MHRLIVLTVFVFIVVLAAAVASQFVGGDWYQAMNQPWWNPPAIMLAAVWAVLYVLMAVSAWMVWDSVQGMAQRALTWWGLQLVLGNAWFWLFFGLHRIGWAMLVMGIWLLAVFITSREFRSIRHQAFRLMIPLAVWLLFALLLNFTQWRLNGGGPGSIL